MDIQTNMSAPVFSGDAPTSNPFSYRERTPLGTSSAKQGKPWKRILLIAAILAAAIAVVAIIITISSKKPESKPEKTVTTADVLNSFNAYVNSLVKGENSASTPAADILKVNPYYIYTLTKTSEKVSYVNFLKTEFYTFTEYYYENGGKLVLDDIDAYFHDYTLINPVSEQEIYDTYGKNGHTAVEELLSKRYSSAGTHESIAKYLQASKAKYRALLNVIEGLDTAGCFVDNRIVAGCDVDQSSYANFMSTYADNLKEAESIIEQLRVSASTELYDVFQELYSENNNNSGVSK